MAKSNRRPAETIGAASAIAATARSGAGWLFRQAKHHDCVSDRTGVADCFRSVRHRRLFAGRGAYREGRRSIARARPDQNGSDQGAIRWRGGLQADDRNHSGSLVGGGRDSLSNSRASGELRFSMSPGQQASTALDIELTFSLQGMLAQFSRPAIVNDFTSFIIEQFTENLSRRLSPGDNKEATADGLSVSRLLRWQAVRFWRRLLGKSPG